MTRGWGVAVGACWLTTCGLAQTINIWAQPQDMDVTVGDSAGFTVRAVGDSLTYQWSHNGVILPDADKAYLHIPGAIRSDEGHYDVRVTSTTDSIVSKSAELTVADTRPTVVDTDFVSKLPPPGQTYPWTSDMMEVFPGGRVWLGGYYGSAPQPYPRLVSVLHTGQYDPIFDGFRPAGQGGIVTHLLRAPGDKVYLAGEVNDPVGSPYFVMRVHPDGSQDASFNTLFLDDPVENLVVHLDGLIVLSSERLNRYLADGSLDGDFQSPDRDREQPLPPLDYRISSVAVDERGRLIAVTRKDWPLKIFSLNNNGTVEETWYPEAPAWLEDAELKVVPGGSSFLITKSAFSAFYTSLTAVNEKWVQVFQLPETWSEPMSLAGRIYWKTIISHRIGPKPTEPSLCPLPAPRERGWGEPSNYGVANSQTIVYGSTNWMAHSSAIDVNGNLFVAVSDEGGPAIRRFSGGTKSKDWFTGTGPDTATSPFALKLHPDGETLYVAGNFQSFDDHWSPGLVRLHTNKSTPISVSMPRQLAVLPVDSAVHANHPFEVDVVAAGAPPFSAVFVSPGVTSTVYAPLVGDFEIVSDDHAQTGVFRLRFPRLPESSSVFVFRDRFRSGSAGIHFDRLDDWTLGPPIIHKVHRSEIEGSTNIRLHADISGAETLFITWLRNGVRVGGQIRPCITISALLAWSGDYQCVAENYLGIARSEIVRVVIEPEAPEIVRIGESPGHGVPWLRFEVRGTQPLTALLTRDGNPFRTITESSGQTTVETYLAGAGNYQLELRNAYGETRSPPLQITTGPDGEVERPIPTIQFNPAPRMTNVSLRAMSGSGERPVILGMVADGPHTLVARAIGPSLTGFGVADVLPDPIIKVYNGNSRTVGQTDILLVDDLARNLGAFKLIEDSPEASLLVDLPPNEPRTLQTRDALHRNGNVLVEAYHFKHDSGRIRNISERAWIKGSDPVAIAGFVLSNLDSFRILIRAAGPSLSEFGVNEPCPDPSIRLFRLGEAEPFATNDDWSEGGSATELIEAFAQAGAFAFEAGSKDAALLVTLGPGEYTAVAEGVDDSDGIVLLEIYDLSEED